MEKKQQSDTNTNPDIKSADTTATSRRKFLKGAAALATALAVSGCGEKDELFVNFLDTQEGDQDAATDAGHDINGDEGLQEYAAGEDVGGEDAGAEEEQVVDGGADIKDAQQEAEQKEVEQCETAQAKSLKIEVENGAVKGQIASGLAEDIVKSGGGNFDIEKSLCTGEALCEFSVSFDSSDKGKTFVIGFVVPAGANVNAQKLSDLLPGNAQALGGYTVYKAELEGNGFRDGSNTPQPTDIKNALEQISEALIQKNDPYKDNPEKSLEGVSGVGKAESIYVNFKKVENTAGNDFKSSAVSTDTLFILAVPVTAKIDSCKLAQAKTRRDFLKLFKIS